MPHILWSVTWNNPVVTEKGRAFSNLITAKKDKREREQITILPRAKAKISYPFLFFLFFSPGDWQLMGRYRGQKSVPHSKFIFSIESGLNYDLPPGHDTLLKDMKTWRIVFCPSMIAPISSFFDGNETRSWQVISNNNFAPRCDLLLCSMSQPPGSRICRQIFKLAPLSSAGKEPVHYKSAIFRNRISFRPFCKKRMHFRENGSAPLFKSSGAMDH